MLLPAVGRSKVQRNDELLRIAVSYVDPIQEFQNPVVERFGHDSRYLRLEECLKFERRCWEYFAAVGDEGMKESSFV